MIGRVITAVVIVGLVMPTVSCTGVGTGGSQRASTIASGCTRAALKPIAVGSQPGPIVITPDGKTAYVANANSGTVTPIRAATNKALKPIRVGSGPGAMVITPSGKTLYIADYDSPGKVVPIQTAANRALKPIKVGRFPEAITITPDGRTVYVLNADPYAARATVTPIRTATNTALKPVKVGPPGFCLPLPSPRTAPRSMSPTSAR